MRINANQIYSIMISNTKIEDILLGKCTIVSTSGDTDEDIKARKRKAQQAFAILRPVWRGKALRTSTKLRIINTNKKSVFLYGSLKCL